MLETLKQTIIIDFSILLNSLIYFLKRIPLLKLLFRETGYEHAGLSRILYVFGLIYSMMKQLFKSLILLLFGFGLPVLLIGTDMGGLNREAVYWYFFFVFYLLLPLPSGRILEPQRRKFISVKLMRMNARKFVLADYFPQLIWRQIVELLLFSITAGLFHVNILLALFMVIAKNFFAVSTEVIQIKYYEKTGSFLHNKVTIIILFYVLILFLGYLSAAFHFILIVPAPVIIVLGVLLWTIGTLSVRYIVIYRNFTAALNDANRLDKLSLDIKSVKANAEFARVKFKDKEFTKEELSYGKTNKREGFAYINDIFFKRHKRILSGPVQKQALAVLLLFAAGVLLILLYPDFHKDYEAGVHRLFPVFIFALYLMSTGQKATRAMFYNCDISLLHYGFYKTKEAVLATFTIRVKRLILDNLLPAGLLAAAVLLLGILSGGSVMTFLPVGIMILVLSVFFVIHNMFLYYIFQPYTTDLNVKNPFYKLFSAITYLLCYMSLQLKNMSIAFLVIVVAVTIIYSIGALITVYRIAPRTFIIK